MNNNNSNNNIDEENIDGFYDYLPADHPLMMRVQAEMEINLKKEEEALRLKFKELSEEQKKIKRTREDIGIKLYGNQQQYAKLEENFNEKYNEYMILKNQREEMDKKLDNIQREFGDTSTKVKEQEKVLLQATEDLNQLNSMLKYVENYNNQLKGEIKLTATTTYVVENNIRNNENIKKEQDFLIDYLENQIKTLTEKKLLYEAQLRSQQMETADARTNLSEANEEIENIRERIKNLLKDWDKSLISMRTRDKALKVVRENILEQEGEKLKYNSQLNRYTDLIQKEFFINNELNHQIKQVLTKQKVSKNQINQLKEKRVKLEEKLNYLKVSINRTYNDLQMLNIKESSLENDIEVINKNKIKLLDEANMLSDKNLIIMSSKETHEKQTENLIKLNKNLNKEIFNTQVEIDSKVNEIARVEIDKLNVETQNDSLKKKLKLMDNEITKYEKIYSENESKIKKNHEDLEKKQLTVDRLNKKFGELTKNKASEDEGLYEIKIKELKSEVETINKNILDAEKDWIDKKRELVSKENVLNNVNEENIDKRSKKMILEHKKLRLNKNYEMHEKEIREVEISLKNLRYDMNKYNGLLSKNVGTKDKLTHKFFDVEIEFKEKLKQMENEAMRLEQEIEVLRDEKADTLTQIMEVERQIHLWERKIQLEETMQEIIKPDKGIKEIDEMKSSIHRQELIYNKLKQEEEQVLKNMEMAIQRREYIKLRYPVDTVTSKYMGKSAKSDTSNRELTTLSNDYNYTVKEKNKITRFLEEKRQEFGALVNNRTNIDIQLNRLQNDLHQTKMDYFTTKLEKNSLNCKSIQNQQTSKILEKFIANTYKPENEERMRKELGDLKSQDEYICDVLIKLKDIYPQYSSFIQATLNI